MPMIHNRYESEGIFEMSKSKRYTSSPLTDKDRIRNAFVRIRKELGFLARMDYMCCQSCGRCGLEETTAFKKSKGKKPYIFWHHQSNEVFDSYGDIGSGRRGRDDDGKEFLYLYHEGTLEQIKAAVQIIREEGMGVDWEESLDKAIKVYSHDFVKDEESMADEIAESILTS
jgi:hypothetical protein